MIHICKVVLKYLGWMRSLNLPLLSCKLREIKGFKKASFIQGPVFCSSSWHPRPPCPHPRLPMTDRQMVQHSTPSALRRGKPLFPKDAHKRTCCKGWRGGKENTPSPPGPHMTSQLPVIWPQHEHHGAGGGLGGCWGASTARAAGSSHCPRAGERGPASAALPVKQVCGHVRLTRKPEMSASREASRHRGALPAPLLPKSQQLPQHPTAEGTRVHMDGLGCLYFYFPRHWLSLRGCTTNKNPSHSQCGSIT